MRTFIKSLLRDITYCFLNYFVSNIPCWFIRKFIYLLFGMKIGKGSRIMMKCIVMAPWRISIGTNSIINEYVLLDGRGGLEIGNSVSISYRTTIYTGTHKSNSNSFEYISKRVYISDCVWIGAGCIIMPGSVVGKKSIISVNSAFSGTGDDYGVYRGVPAEYWKDRSEIDDYELKHIYFFR